jgi:hypothetical protein
MSLWPREQVSDQFCFAIVCLWVCLWVCRCVCWACMCVCPWM